MNRTISFRESTTDMEVAMILMHLFLRALLGGILLCSGIAKVAHPRRSTQALRDYKLLPSSLETRPALPLALALGTALAEIGTGLGLLSGLGLPIASALALSLFVLFSAALILNLVRGRTDLSCHCGGVLGDHRISWWLVGRNGLFIATTLVLLELPSDPFLVDHSPMPDLTTWVNTALPVALVVSALLVVFALLNVTRMILRPERTRS